MRYLIFILSLIVSIPTIAQVELGMVKKKAVVAQFNFTLTGFPNSVPGWVQVIGDPYTAIVTASDSRSGSAISLSTVGTGATYWNWNTVAAGGYVSEVDANDYSWPAAVGSGYFFNQSTTYIAGGNLKLSGFVVGGRYRIQVFTNRPQVTDNRQTKIACIDSSGTNTFVSINSAPSSTGNTLVTQQVLSAGTIVTFNDRIPNTSGEIWLGICAAATYTYGYINAIRITRIQ